MAVMREDDLPLADFVALPSSVAFNILNEGQYQQLRGEQDRIHLGTILETGLVAAYTNEQNIPQLFRELGSDFVGFFPQVFSPLGQSSNAGAGITPVLESPYLGISGKGVIIGIVDSGIDYTKACFRKQDGSSKILGIWDQTLEGPRSAPLYYGAEFLQQEITQALESEDPFALVPTRDERGHGTFLASVAAGGQTGDFIGSAPEAELLVVKLRPTRPFYRRKYLLSDEEEALYTGTDFMLGAHYIFSRAEQLGKPVVLLVGLGSNLSGHDGSTPVEEYLSDMSRRSGVAAVTAAGNESAAQHHTQGKLLKSGAQETISLRVGESCSFTLAIFAASYERISISLRSPEGEILPRVPFRAGLELTRELLFEGTKVSLGYYQDVNTSIILGFENAREGMWELTLYADAVLEGAYYAWLPISGQVNEAVEFMRPVPEYTVVSPATALRSITCGAYDNRRNTLYPFSSWGPTRLPRMSPDFVAPGVGVDGIYPWGAGQMTGSSAAAAVTAGAAALLMEWALVQGNMKTLDGDSLRLLLISGCTREEGTMYPNTRWGYGKLNLYGSFLKMQESAIVYERTGGIP